MDKQLPIYELTIDDTPDGQREVNYVALVDRPAIDRNFLAFNADKNPFAFAAVDEEQRMLVGPAMIPDYPIYRNDDQLGEYCVTFSRETIKQIALRFFEKGYQSNVNIMHDPAQQLEGVVFFQSFIKDSSKGLNMIEDGNPDGTWYLGAYVKPDDVWQAVKEGKFKGFSVEGLFKMRPKKVTMSEQQLFSALQQIFS